MSTTSEPNDINGTTLHKRSQSCFDQIFGDFIQKHVGGGIVVVYLSSRLL